LLCIFISILEYVPLISHHCLDAQTSADFTIHSHVFTTGDDAYLLLFVDVIVVAAIGGGG
jgi:hypothetical protein